MQEEKTAAIEEPSDGMDIRFGKFIATLNLHECNLLDLRIRNEIFKAVQGKLYTLVTCNMPLVELSIKAGLKEDPAAAKDAVQRVLKFIRKVVQIQVEGDLCFALEATKSKEISWT